MTWNEIMDMLQKLEQKPDWFLGVAVYFYQGVEAADAKFESVFGRTMGKMTMLMPAEICWEAGSVYGVIVPAMSKVGEVCLFRRSLHG